MTKQILTLFDFPSLKASPRIYCKSPINSPLKRRQVLTIALRPFPITYISTDTANAFKNSSQILPQMETYSSCHITPHIQDEAPQTGTMQPEDYLASSSKLTDKLLSDAVLSIHSMKRHLNPAPIPGCAFPLSSVQQSPPSNK